VAAKPGKKPRILMSVTEANLTVLQRDSLARHIRRLRRTCKGPKATTYRDLARTTGIPLSVLHGIAPGQNRHPWLD
jgi:hypothetical protein